VNKFDIDTAGFSPVGDLKSMRDFNQAYTDYVIDKHNSSEDAHKNLEK